MYYRIIRTDEALRQRLTEIKAALSGIGVRSVRREERSEFFDVEYRRVYWKQLVVRGIENDGIERRLTYGKRLCCVLRFRIEHEFGLPASAGEVNMAIMEMAGS